MNPATPAAGGPEIGPCLLMTSWLVDWLVSWFDCGLVSWGFLVFYLQYLWVWEKLERDGECLYNFNSHCA